jgi:hypothetical protein
MTSFLFRSTPPIDAVEGLLVEEVLRDPVIVLNLDVQFPL